MAVCACSSTVMLRCGAGGLVIVADAAVEEMVVAGGGVGVGRVTGAPSGFLCWHTLYCPFPACLKNAQLQSPSAENLAQSTQTAP